MLKTNPDVVETVVAVPVFGTKQCPRCGNGLFDDMDTCYDCLYEYPEDAAVLEGAAEEEVPTEVYAQGLSAHDDRPEGRRRVVLRISTHDLEVALPIADGGIVVGRGESCDVMLRSRSVSRKHVRILPVGDGADVRNLGARNQAMLNGVRVSDCMHMVCDDVLDVCGVTFTLQRA